MAKLLHPAPPWSPPRSDKIRLWHGTIRRHAVSIENHGIDPTKSRADTDFGRGFYTTTVRRQAEQWAFAIARAIRHPGKPGDNPVVIRFDVDRIALGLLDTLSFVRGDFSHDDFWSLVQHCRQSTRSVVRDHLHPNLANPGWYDVVVGPVAAFWKQRVPMQEADQISFHTKQAATILNAAIGRKATDFEVIDVI